MRVKWKSLAACVAIPLVVGGISAFITKNSFERFSDLAKPPLSPPGWVFPIMWSILYVLMGIASYLVFVSDFSKTTRKDALRLYGIQLLFNFAWSIWFFNFGLYYFSFIWLAILWILILGTIISFGKISKPAAYLMVPYILWVSFAGYLNLGIALLN